MKNIRDFAYGLAFLSPLLGETDLLTIAGVKIPAMLNIGLFVLAFVMAKKRELGFLLSNRIVIWLGIYLVIVFCNYAFVLHDLFFKAYAELTPIWISMFRRIITVLYIYLIFKDEEEAIRLFHFYCAGLVFSSLCAYPEMLVFKHAMFNASATIGNEGYQRARGFFSNPNDFALTTVVAFIFVYHQYLLTKRKFLLMLMFLLIPPIFLSYSRNGLACLLLAIFLAYVVGRRVKLRLILYSIFAFIALIGVVVLVPSIRERVLLLFSGQDESAIGRYLVIYAAYDKWLTMPLMGIGALSAPLLMEDFGNEGLLITIHNYYAHALFETGILGFITVMGFLYCIYKANKNLLGSDGLSPKVFMHARAYHITLIVTFFYIFSGNHIVFDFFWYLLGVLFVILKAESKRKAASLSNL